MILYVVYNSLDSEECRSFGIIIIIVNLDNEFPAQWIHDHCISFKWFVDFWPSHQVAGTNGF